MNKRRYAGCWLVLVGLLLTPVAACTRGPNGPLAGAGPETATMTVDSRRGDNVSRVAGAATATPSLPAKIQALERVGYLAGGPIRALVARGDLAFAGQGRMLSIVDGSDPARPRRTGSVVLAGNVLDLAVAPRPGSGQVRVYAALAEGGLAIVDPSDPARPVAAGTIDLPVPVRAVATDGAYLYVAAGDLRVFDLGRASAPVGIGVYRPEEPTGYADKVLAPPGRYVYTVHHGASGRAGSLRVVDVSDPAAPVEAGVYRAGVPIRDAAIAGDRAYLLAGLGVPYLVVVDLSDPTRPVAVAPDRPKTWLGQSLAVDGHTLLLASPSDPGALQVLDVADPVQPVLLGRIEGLPLPTAGIVARPGRAILAAGDRLLVADLSELRAPRVAGSHDLGGISAEGRAVAVAGDHAYVAAGRDGLWVVDVSDPATPRVTGHLDTAGHAWDVAVRNGYAYLADEHNGLRVVDVRDPARPVEAGSYDVPGPAEFFADVAVGAGTGRRTHKRYAYIADALPGDTSLRVVDVTDPAAPREVSRLPLGAGLKGDVRAYGLALSGDHVYLCLGAAGLRVVDVSDPSAPVEVGALDLPGRADDVVVDAGRAYLVDGDLRVVDVTDPASPRETGFYDVPGPSPWPHVAVEGRLVVLSAQGTSVLDGPDPGAPRVTASYPSAQGAVALANGLVYVLGNGLTVLRPLDRAAPSPSPTATPVPGCDAYSASVSAWASHTRPHVGDVLTVTVRLANQGCGLLGMPQYSLHVETEGEQPVFAATPEPVLHLVGLTAGVSDTVTFALRAARPGRAALTAAASFEFHAASPGPGYWGGARSGPLHVSVLAPEPELLPVEGAGR